MDVYEINVSTTVIYGYPHAFIQLTDVG